MDLYVPVRQAEPEDIERRWRNVNEQAGYARVETQLLSALHVHT